MLDDDEDEGDDWLLKRLIMHCQHEHIVCVYEHDEYEHVLQNDKLIEIDEIRVLIDSQRIDDEHDDYDEIHEQHDVTDEIDEVDEHLELPQNCADEYDVDTQCVEKIDEHHIAATDDDELDEGFELNICIDVRLTEAQTHIQTHDDAERHEYVVVQNENINGMVDDEAEVHAQPLVQNHIVDDDDGEPDITVVLVVMLHIIDDDEVDTSLMLHELVLHLDEKVANEYLLYLIQQLVDIQ